MIKFKSNILDSYEKELLYSFVKYSKYDINEFELFDELEAVQKRMNFSDKQMKKKLKRITYEFERHMQTSVANTCREIVNKIIV